MWNSHNKREDIVATVHGDDIRIGGERTAVEFLVRLISKKYEIKKQVIGEDPDLEQSGRTLNRVIELNRDGITIEADQRHVREILKCFELKRANHTTSPCPVDRKDADGARNDESKGEESTWTWTGTGPDQARVGPTADNADDRNRRQMADDDANDSQSQDRPDLLFASMQVCCTVAKPTTRDMERVKRINRYLAGWVPVDTHSTPVLPTGRRLWVAHSTETPQARKQEPRL